MVALILNVVLLVGFFHTIRSAQVQGCNMVVVGAVNYLVASFICFGISVAKGNLSLSTVTLFWGTIQGVAFVSAFYLICASMVLSGMAIASAIIRLAVVIPVLASILYWGEVPSPYQVIGIIACLGSLPLIGTRARNIGKGGPIDWRELRTIGLLFFVMGMVGVASKAFVEADVPDSTTTFMAVVFAVSSVGALVTFLAPVNRKQWRGVWHGLKIGVFNASANVAFLIGLTHISGVVAFPVQAVGSLLLNTLFASVVWRERFLRRTLAGIGLAALGLALVNLK
jgi:drug/metabolite transporter (DMT)-like permease